MNVPESARVNAAQAGGCWPRQFESKSFALRIMEGNDRARRIAFLTTHPIQYFAPLYAYLQGTGSFSVTALYLSDFSVRGGTDPGFRRSFKWDLDLLHGYEARFIRGAEKRNAPSHFFSCIAPDLWREIQRGNFDALVVHGHTPAAMLMGALGATANRIPVFMRCETYLGLQRSRLKSLLRRPLLRAIYSGMAGVLAIGTRNADFYRAMGVPSHRIFYVPYTVDNARFIGAATLDREQRNHMRQSLGIDNDLPVLLFIGKLQRRKRSDDLLHAAAVLRQRGLAFHVLFVGSGEMEDQLAALTRELDLNNVRFAGFANQSVLPRVYAAADIFVFPSEEEPWELVVNEAMCAGLPIVASGEVGCAPDLVHDHVNGRRYPAGNVAALANALEPLVRSAELRERMGKASRKIIEMWSYAECRQGIEAALQATGGSKFRTR